MGLARGVRRAPRDAPPARRAPRLCRARTAAAAALSLCLLALAPIATLGARPAPARSLRASHHAPAAVPAGPFAVLAGRSRLIQQGPKLTGGGENGEGLFGASVALSADGNTALVGAPSDDNDVGAVWVFTRTGSVWSQQGQRLTGAGEVGRGAFGASVALSADGNTALIGGREDAGGVGAAWVFTRSGTTWSQQGHKLTGAEESGAGAFGSSVALSTNGTTALIGGQRDDDGVGAAWVLARAGSSFAQQGQKLTGAEESGAGAFGYSSALSADGDTALIGGEADGGGVGAAWAFTRSGTTWSQQGHKLTGQTGADKAFFGCSVALSGAGNVALVGGHDYEDVGATWEFKRSHSRWRERGAPLAGGEEAGFGAFGSSLALSSDGETALVGGVGDDSFIGAAWVFVAHRR